MHARVVAHQAGDVLRHDSAVERLRSRVGRLCFGCRRKGAAAQDLCDFPAPLADIVLDRQIIPLPQAIDALIPFGFCVALHRDPALPRVGVHELVSDNSFIGEEAGDWPGVCGLVVVES